MRAAYTSQLYVLCPYTIPPCFELPVANPPEIGSDKELIIPDGETYYWPAEFLGRSWDGGTQGKRLLGTPMPVATSLGAPFARVGQTSGSAISQLSFSRQHPDRIWAVTNDCLFRGDDYTESFVELHRRITSQSLRRSSTQFARSLFPMVVCTHCAAASKPVPISATVGGTPDALERRIIVQRRVPRADGTRWLARGGEENGGAVKGVYRSCKIRASGYCLESSLYLERG